jgi:hypothetical protein
LSLPFADLLANIGAGQKNRLESTGSGKNIENPSTGKDFAAKRAWGQLYDELPPAMPQIETVAPRALNARGVSAPISVVARCIESDVREGTD